MSINVHAAKAAVTAMFPVTAEPAGTRPARLQDRMKKNRVKK
jgi:hypothetical protein